MAQSSARAEQTFENLTLMTAPLLPHYPAPWPSQGWVLSSARRCQAHPGICRQITSRSLKRKR